MEWSRIIQYRTDAFLWMFAEAAMPLISLAIWYTVATSSTRGPTPTEVLTYYILVMFVKIMTDSWNGAFLARDILSGEVVKLLVKPMAVVWHGIVNNILEKIFKLLLPIAVFSLALVTFSDAFAPAIYQPVNVLLGLLSLGLAIPLGFMIDEVIGYMAFWLENVFQIRRYKMMLESVASGLLIPFAFMPPLAVSLLGYLPFRYVISAPAEILAGNTVAASPITVIGIQASWVAAMILLARFLWMKGLRRYAVPGQ